MHLCIYACIFIYSDVDIPLEQHFLLLLTSQARRMQCLGVCCSVCSAAEHIQRGEADLMLAGGAEAAIIPSGIGGFIACRALSSRNQDPTKASRPWDKNRDGFVMGEGAGMHKVLLLHSKNCPVRFSCFFSLFLFLLWVCV